MIYYNQYVWNIDILEYIEVFTCIDIYLTQLLSLFIIYWQSIVVSCSRCYYLEIFCPQSHILSSAVTQIDI